VFNVGPPLGLENRSWCWAKRRREMRRAEVRALGLGCGRQRRASGRLAGADTGEAGEKAVGTGGGGRRWAADVHINRSTALETNKDKFQNKHSAGIADSACRSWLIWKPLPAGEAQS